jgi:hypothetical protein
MPPAIALKAALAGSRMLPGLGLFYYREGQGRERIEHDAQLHSIRLRAARSLFHVFPVVGPLVHVRPINSALSKDKGPPICVGGPVGKAMTLGV